MLLFLFKLFNKLRSTTQSLQIASNQAQNAFAYAPEIQKGINAASRAVALLNTQPKLKDPEVPAVEPFVSKLYIVIFNLANKVCSQAILYFSICPTSKSCAIYTVRVNNVPTLITITLKTM